MDTNDKKHTKRRPSPEQMENSQRSVEELSRNRRAGQKEKKRKRADSKVVYTEAKPFNRKRFILQLVTVVAVVVALLLGTSIFFKAKNVVVSGAEKYTAYEIRQAAGIQDDDNLLLVNRAKISARLTSQLPYIKSVRVQIKLPDTVMIEVEEIDVTYAIQAVDEQWWLMDKDGKVIETISAAESKDHTVIKGVRLDAPVAGQTAVAEEPKPQETMADGQTVPPTVYGSERLSAVLIILQNLEKRGLIGNDVVSVDVSEYGNIELWYKEQYQVFLGGIDQMDKKIHELKRIIEEKGEYENGILDISYTTHPDGVVHTDFETAKK